MQKIRLKDLLLYVSVYPKLTHGERVLCCALLGFWDEEQSIIFASIGQLRGVMKNSKTGKPISATTIKKDKKSCASKGVFNLWNSKNEETNLNNSTGFIFDPQKVLAVCQEYYESIEGSAPAEESETLQSQEVEQPSEGERLLNERGPFKNHGDRLKAFFAAAEEFGEILGSEEVDRILANYGFSHPTKVRKRDDMYPILEDLHRAAKGVV